MSRGVNKIILLGNLGADPEMRNTQSGKAVANLNIATSESWTDKNTGQKQEKTEWHKVVFFDRLAEVAGQYLKKGSKIYIEGKLQTRKWQNQQGVDQYTTEIVGNEMQMLDGRSDGGGQQQGGYQQQPAQQQAYAAPQYQQQPAQQQVQPQYNQQKPMQQPQQQYQAPMANQHNAQQQQAYASQYQPFADSDREIPFQ